MKIEHLAFTVPDPVAFAAWYEKHLAMRVVRSGAPPINARFLADSRRETLLEVYNNPKVRPPDYFSMDPLLLHVAFLSDNPEADRDRLLAAGATLVDDVTVIASGDKLAMLRDPWGVPIQLMKRAAPLR